MSEVIALVFSLFILFWFYLQSTNFLTFYDLQNFLNAGKGDFSHYYYAYWIVPFFSVLAKLPYPFPFLIIGLADILGAFFAVRVFGGKLLPLLVSIHMIYILSQGQITGLILGGFALYAIGLIQRKWHLAGLGMLIATIKYQMGLLPTLALLALWEANGKDKLKVFLVPAAVTLASLFLYPSWPVKLIHNIQSTPPFSEGSISLWQWVGPFALALWIPPFLPGLTRGKKFVLLLTANALSLPYFQQTDLILLFSLFAGYGAAASNLPFLVPSATPWALIRLLLLIPLGIYTAELGRWLMEKLSKSPG